MDRNHTARFEKRGARAARVANRDALALVESECEKYVREKMKPELVRAARQAVSGFRRQSGR